MLWGAGSSWWESNVLCLRLLRFRVFQSCGWIMFLESNGALSGATYLARKVLGSCSAGHKTHNLDLGPPQNSGLSFCKFILVVCTGFFSECLVFCMANIIPNKNVTTADHLQVKNFLPSFFIWLNWTCFPYVSVEFVYSINASCRTETVVYWGCDFQLICGHFMVQTLESPTLFERTLLKVFVICVIILLPPQKLLPTKTALF